MDAKEINIKSAPGNMSIVAHAICENDSPVSDGSVHSDVSFSETSSIRQDSARRLTDEETEAPYMTAAESFRGLTLSELPKHKCRLEREKNAALQSGEQPRVPASEHAQKKHKEQAMDSLDAILKPHQSRLQKEKEAAKKQHQPRVPASSGPISRGSIDHDYHQQSLDALLKPYKCRLEREREESNLVNEPRRPPLRHVEDHAPLESINKKHYSKLQLEKMAAEADKQQQSAASSAAGRHRKSALQLEREAAALVVSIAEQADASKAAEKEREAEEKAAREAEEKAAKAGVVVDQEVIHDNGECVVYEEGGQAVASSIDVRDEEDGTPSLIADASMSDIGLEADIATVDKDGGDELRDDTLAVKPQELLEAGDDESHYAKAIVDAMFAKISVS